MELRFGRVSIFADQMCDYYRPAAMIDETEYDVDRLKPVRRICQQLCSRHVALGKRQVPVRTAVPEGVVLPHSPTDHADLAGCQDPNK